MWMDALLLEFDQQSRENHSGIGRKQTIVRIPLQTHSIASDRLSSLSLPPKITGNINFISLLG